jgi:hypothetical protein
MKQQAGFQKGNREATKRRRCAGGRPTREAQAQKKLAGDRARERIEASVDAVMDEYIRLAKGGRVRKGSSPATIRHYVERLVSAARQGIDISTNGDLEQFYKACQEAEWLEIEEAKTRARSDTSQPPLNSPNSYGSKNGEEWS